MRTSLTVLLSAALMVTLTVFNTPVYAAQNPNSFFGSDLAAKAVGGAIAFGLAAFGAGYAVARAGAAAIAGTAEKPEIRTYGIIITALGEAIAIYGIVMAILILGQTG